MGERRRYENAPISEAVISLRPSFDAPVAAEDFERALEAERDRYPERRQLKEGRGQIQFGKEIKAHAESRDLGIAAVSADKKQVAQFSQNGFAFSRLAPYESWEPFCDEACRLWNIFRQSFAIARIAKLGVRFINRIDLPKDCGDIADWFNVYPKIDDEISLAMSGFLLHLQLPQPTISAELVLIQTADLVRSFAIDKSSIILDIELSRTTDVPQDEGDIWRYFDVLRDRKDEVFESCITEKTRQLFK